MITKARAEVLDSDLSTHAKLMALALIERPNLTKSEIEQVCNFSSATRKRAFNDLSAAGFFTRKESVPYPYPNRFKCLPAKCQALSKDRFSHDWGNTCEHCMLYRNDADPTTPFTYANYEKALFENGRVEELELFRADRGR